MVHSTRNPKTLFAVRLGWVVLVGIVFWQATLPDPYAVTTKINDKIGHLLIFTVLGIWAQLGWWNYKSRRMLIGFLSIYGFAIEWVQYFVPGRYFSLLDWLADILGLIIAVILIKLNPRTGSDYA